jgi:hypothetical protein
LLVQAELLLRQSLVLSMEIALYLASLIRQLVSWPRVLAVARNDEPAKLIVKGGDLLAAVSTQSLKMYPHK